LKIKSELFGIRIVVFKVSKPKNEIIIICSPFGTSVKVAIPSKSLTAPFSNSSKYTVAPNNGSFSDSETIFICISDVCAFI
jgi:hypothetical protein